MAAIDVAYSFIGRPKIGLSRTVAIAELSALHFFDFLGCMDSNSCVKCIGIENQRIEMFGVDIENEMPVLRRGDGFGAPFDSWATRRG